MLVQTCKHMVKMAWTPDNWAKLKATRQRLEKCWDIDIDWSLYPEQLKEVTKTWDNYCLLILRNLGL